MLSESILGICLLLAQKGQRMLYSVPIGNLDLDIRLHDSSWALVGIEWHLER